MAFMGQSNRPKFSFIIAAYNMKREIERTLASLSRDYQRDVDGIPYEVIVVENGSSEPLDGAAIEQRPDTRYLYVDSESQSPVSALNQAAEMSTGEVIVLMVDGARMLSPGVVSWANRAYEVFEDPVVSVLGFHLGFEIQATAAETGYCQEVEDQLLESICWQEDGYRRFRISCLAGSAAGGWHFRAAESNCLFLPRKLYHSLGGFEEKFQAPGGGLCNLDLYKRVAETPGLTLLNLHGEGCFHQYHGGVTTGGSKLTFEDLKGEYETIRGYPYELPNLMPTQFGHSPLEATHHLLAGSERVLETNPELVELREQARSLVDGLLLKRSKWYTRWIRRLSIPRCRR
jgi:hypothetical protein